MGYADKSGGVFFSALFRAFAAPEQRPRFGKGDRRISHGASLPLFLIFCKILSSGPFVFGRLIPKAIRSGRA
jgi:hypothetical protein